MRGLRGAGWAAALAVALPLSGCATVFGDYELAPNGLASAEDEFRRTLAFEAPTAYQTAIDGSAHLPHDDLLRLLFAAAAGRYAGAHEESSRLLDAASYLAADRVTLSLSREALSLITSDRVLEYVPGRTERLMIHYLAALNYLDAGDAEAAAVEARRIEALLDQLDSDSSPTDRSRQHQFLHYFAATVFEAARDWNAADVALRRAGPLGESVTAGLGAGTAADSLGDVLVLVEQGFVPHRREQSVMILLPAEQATMLRDGPAGEKALAAAEAAARILLTASHLYGDRSGYYLGPGYRPEIRLDPWRDDRCVDGSWAVSGGRCEPVEENGNPYLLRISWPVLYQERVPLTVLRVRAGDLATDATARFDVAAAVHEDFNSQRAAILRRSVIRAAAKLAVSAAVEDAVGEHDETAGRIAGLLANLGTAATERADTRAWHLLPGSISLARLQLPAGSHDITLETDGGASSLGTVTVRPGQTSFVSTRLWR